MTKMEAWLIGWTTARDGEYNGISGPDVIQQIIKMPQSIQDSFTDGYYEQEIDKIRKRHKHDKI